MRRLLGAVPLLSLAALAWGAEAEKHNTLTEKEAADGWLLLFDGESTYGWRSPNESKWTVASGMLAPQAGKPGLLSTKPLFNGKDLSGWKEYPGKKSRFSVTKEGWLNIKNGPGDLQTEGQWADFVLQLDCISNGQHLNSGVFFRCIPGQYQN